MRNARAVPASAVNFSIVRFCCLNDGSNLNTRWKHLRHFIAKTEEYSCCAI